MINLKFALRTLFKSPFVTVVAIVSLALGIGANAAIFSLFNQMLLRALPVQEPGRLVNLAAPGPKPGSQQCSNAGNCDVVLSYPMFRDLERVQSPFTGIAAHRSFSANLAYRDQTTSGDGMLVSGSYFPVLGVRPALGRLLGPGDDAVVGESHVAVLGYSYWQNRFASNPSVLNDTLTVNGQSLTIVGVAARGLRRDDARHPAADLRAHHSARHDDPRLQGVRQPHELLGLRVRAAQARHLDRTGADGHQPALSPDRQRRRSVAAEGAQRSDDDAVPQQVAARRAGRTRPEQRVGRSARTAAAADGRDRVRAVDCLRQHRQPAARTRRRHDPARWRCACRSARAAGS